MATTELTTENFNSIVEDNDIVIIDFWADWCGPCKMFAPTYESAAEDNPDVVWGKIDTQAQQQLAAAFNIRAIPTLMVIKEQIPIFSQSGALPRAALDELVGKARDLDMDEVRAAIEEQEAEGGAPS